MVHMMSDDFFVFSLDVTWFLEPGFGCQTAPQAGCFHCVVLLVPTPTDQPLNELEDYQSLRVCGLRIYGVAPKPGVCVCVS